MKKRSASSRRANLTRKSGAGSSANDWRPNPYAKRFSSSGRRRLALTALLAEFGPEVAILAPDLALAFPSSIGWRAHRFGSSPP
jgi:hypothetical protein